MMLALLITRMSRPGAALSAFTSSSSGWVASRAFDQATSASVCENTTFSTSSSQAPRSRVRAGMAGSRVMPGHTE